MGIKVHIIDYFSHSICYIGVPRSNIEDMSANCNNKLWVLILQINDYLLNVDIQWSVRKKLSTIVYLINHNQDAATIWYFWIDCIISAIDYSIGKLRKYWKQ